MKKDPYPHPIDDRWGVMATYDELPVMRSADLPSTLSAGPLNGRRKILKGHVPVWGPIIDHGLNAEVIKFFKEQGFDGTRAIESLKVPGGVAFFYADEP